MEANIETLFDYLQVKGYDVVVARDGADAVQLAREVIPDLILMDIQMPIMSGIDATRMIRDREANHEGPSGARIPIIALTAHDSDVVVAYVIVVF